MFGNFNGRLRGKSLILYKAFSKCIYVLQAVYFCGLENRQRQAAFLRGLPGRSGCTATGFLGKQTISSDPCLSYLVQNNTVASQWGILDCTDVHEYLCEKALVKP